MVQQATYLTAEQSLEQLTVTDPSKHFSRGVGKTSAGVGLIALPLAATYAALRWYIPLIQYVLTEHPDHGILGSDGVHTLNNLDKTVLGLLSFGGLVVTAAGIFSGHHGRRFLGEGIASLREHYRTEPVEDPGVFDWNSGFTRLPSGNTKYATIVHPVNSAADLSQHAGDDCHVMVNGFEKGRIEDRLVAYTNVNRVITYDTIINGHLNGQELQFVVRTNRDLAERLSDAPPGTGFMFEGPLSKPEQDLLRLDIRLCRNALNTADLDIAA